MESKKPTINKEALKSDINLKKKAINKNEIIKK